MSQNLDNKCPDCHSKTGMQLLRKHKTTGHGRDVFQCDNCDGYGTREFWNGKVKPGFERLCGQPGIPILFG